MFQRSLNGTVIGLHAQATANEQRTGQTKSPLPGRIPLAPAPFDNQVWSPDASFQDGSFFQCHRRTSDGFVQLLVHINCDSFHIFSEPKRKQHAHSYLNPFFIFVPMFERPPLDRALADRPRRFRSLPGELISIDDHHDGRRVFHLVFYAVAQHLFRALRRHGWIFILCGSSCCAASLKPQWRSPTRSS